jgi:hypothetical protein
MNSILAMNIKQKYSESRRLIKIKIIDNFNIDYLSFLFCLQLSDNSFTIHCLNRLILINNDK